MNHPAPSTGIRGRLAAAGCVAPDEEAAELEMAASRSGESLEGLLRRRLSGVPLAWVTGCLVFAGVRLAITDGVYVPRHESEALARRAAELLAPDGLAVDLCTGSGAIAAVLSARRPAARVLATDIDPAACACAVSNGVEVYCGDLDEPLPAGLAGHVDIVTAVVPYVPTAALSYLPRDALEYEPMLALWGGDDGMVVLTAAVDAAARLLRRGGYLLLELGGVEGDLLAPLLVDHGFVEPCELLDEEGDLRGIETRLGLRQAA